MADTPTVKLHSDGSIECAKGLELAQCGYKVGDKVCGKCGAGTVSVKSDEIESDDEWVSVDGTKVTRMDTTGTSYAPKMSAGEKPLSGSKPNTGGIAQGNGVDRQATSGVSYSDGLGDTPNLNPEKKPNFGGIAQGNGVDRQATDGVSYAEAFDDNSEEVNAARKKARKKRMTSMGVKSEDFDDDAFVCAFERKMYPGGAQVCASCPGGCAAEQDMPSLLEVEGIAEDMFSGKILDSGYSDETDIYVVDIQRKDGKPIEAFFDGSTGECMGWHLLNQDVIGEVAEISATKVISFAEAADIAVKSIEGEAVSVDADMFEGYDAFAVEVEGIDGKSYDVFVGLDGEILGWDEYDAEEAADIDAEVADLALKRMYSEEARTALAQEGMALPDGSFPIKTRADLQNAISAYGRAKDKEAAKKHIMKRAEALDAIDMIPASWKESPESTASDAMGAKSDIEAAKLLADLMEFEMLAVEQGIEE